MKRLRRILLAAMLTVAAYLFAACALIPSQEPDGEPTAVPTVISTGTISAVGRLLPARQAVLGLPVGGTLDELPVAVGSTVRQGDLLAQVLERESQQAVVAQAGAELLAARQGLQQVRDSAALAQAANEQRVVQARSALAEARHALTTLDTQAFRDRLDDKSVAVTKAEDTLDKAGEELDKHLDLDPTNATRKQAQAACDRAEKALQDAVYARDTLQNQLDLAQAAVRVATENLAEAERAAAATADGPDADQLGLARERVAAGEAAVAAAESALALTQLRAPFAGTVLDLHGLEPAMRVAAGAPVVTLADTSVWVVETTDLTELDVVRVSEGQQALVVPDAVSELTLTGVVESIVAVPVEKSGDVLYTVRIRLNESDPRLRWGMTVDVRLEE